MASNIQFYSNDSIRNLFTIAAVMAFRLLILNEDEEILEKNNLLLLFKQLHLTALKEPGKICHNFRQSSNAVCIRTGCSCSLALKNNLDTKALISALSF